MDPSQSLNISKLQHLQGIANHVEKFAKNLAHTIQPLQDFLQKETEWIWEESQKIAFQALKK